MSFVVLASVVLLFAVSILLGLAVSWNRQIRSEDYFLADHRLPWYAVALSLAGASFGLEHILGMIGLAYVMGIGSASFAWGNFVAYSLLLWVVLPYLYRKKLYGPGEFLERRYSRATRGVFAGAMLLTLLVGVLAPALYLGGSLLATTAFGWAGDIIHWTLITALVLLALATAAYAVYGGLAASVWTSVLQMLLVAAGGTFLAVVAVQHAGGWQALAQKNIAADASRMVLFQPFSNATIPWTGVLAFCATLAVWHTAISPLSVQRCLGARSEWDAKMGVIGGGFLQVLLPLVIVVPGLAAFVVLAPQVAPRESDQVLLRLIDTLFPRATWPGVLAQGLIVSAVLAAVMSTIAGVLNAFSAVWTIDLCQDLWQQNASEAEMVSRGRRSSLVAIVLATILAPLMLAWPKGLFDYVLEVAAVVSPPIAVVFLVGFFWPRAHGRAAAFTLVLGIAAGAFLWVVAEHSPVAPPWILPVLHRAGLSGLFSLVLLGLATFAIPQNPRELYDPDTTWNRDWTRLPPYEEDLGEGPRNLVFWWAVMLVATLVLWVVFK